MKDVYILNAKRSALGSFMGGLSSLKSTEIAAEVIKGTIETSNIDKDKIEHVYMGQVLQAGVGQAPARQATIFSGLKDSTPAVTVNKVCGSGLQALIDASRAIMVGDLKLAIAGGMENMSQVPHFIKMRNGNKFGNSEFTDGMIHDGLWDVYTNQVMGNCAEACVEKYNYSREQLDTFAISSFKKAQAAQESGVFNSEIHPITIKGRKGDIVIDTDEGPGKAKFDKIPKLRPAFIKDGKITAANASTLNDGAAAILIGGEEYKDQAKFKIRGWAGFAHESTWFTTAPVGAMKKNLEKCGLKISDIDLFEINEAFATVTMAAMTDLEIPEEKVNVYGGAISLGHPLGCSGARILVTLMNALERENKKLGMASLCIGGGEALSIIIEKL